MTNWKYFQLTQNFQLADYFQAEDLLIATESYINKYLENICDELCGKEAFEGLSFMNGKVLFEKLRKTLIGIIQTFFLNFDEEDNGFEEFLRLDFQTLKDIMFHKEENLGFMFS